MLSLIPLCSAHVVVLVVVLVPSVGVPVGGALRCRGGGGVKRTCC
jgi:hypothetical protein